MNSVDYLRISITDRCNLRCLYCSPLGENVVDRGELLTLEEISRVAGAAVSEGMNRIRITGGEPTVRKGLCSLLEMISSIPGLRELMLTTNGLLLATFAEGMKASGLSRVNVSLDTLDRDEYHRMTGVDGLGRVLEGIDAARTCGLEPVKLNVVAIRGFNDDEVKDFALFASRENLVVRFIEMMPFHCNSALQKERFLSTRRILTTLREFFHLEEIDGKGPGPARYYRISGGRGAIGLISPFSRPFCSTCNRLRLTAMGGLRNCLFSDSEIDLKAPLRGGATSGELVELLRSAARSKENGHNLVHGNPGCGTFSISQIGG